MNYTKCKYCEIIYNIDDDHEDSCITNYSENQLLFCYSCGKTDKEYTSSQRAKLYKARCTDCVFLSKFQRYIPYNYNIQEELLHSISNICVDKVLDLLNQNADPNYFSQKKLYNNNKFYPLYDKDGSIVFDDSVDQPITPLRLCIFRISDCTLTNVDHEHIILIVKMLIKYGAKTNDAYLYFINRYSDRYVYENVFSLLQQC